MHIKSGTALAFFQWDEDRSVRLHICKQCLNEGASLVFYDRRAQCFTDYCMQTLILVKLDDSSDILRFWTLSDLRSFLMSSSDVNCIGSWMGQRTRPEGERIQPQRPTEGPVNGISWWGDSVKRYVETAAERAMKLRSHSLTQLWLPGAKPGKENMPWCSLWSNSLTVQICNGK